jgi:hypothetical protein
MKFLMTLKKQQTKKKEWSVIEKNLSKTLVDVLSLTYHPDCQWLIKEMLKVIESN